jgi:hypothetical protein
VNFVIDELSLQPQRALLNNRPGLLISMSMPGHQRRSVRFNLLQSELAHFGAGLLMIARVPGRQA